MTSTLDNWPAISWLWLVESAAFFALLQWSWTRQVPGVRAFRGLVFGSMLYVACEALNLTLPAGTLRYWLSGLSFVGIGTILPNLAVLFPDITGQNQWLTNSRRHALYAIGLGLGLVRFADPWWGLMYRSERIVHEHGMFLSQYEQGLLHYFLMSGLLAAMLLGLVHIALAWRDANRLLRRHLAVLAVSCLIPVVTSVLYNAGLKPWGALELTPFSLLGTAGLTTWAIFHDRLVEIAPIARNYLVDHFHEGVLVVDATGIVVDTNPALRRMLNLDEGDVLGRPVPVVVKPWPALAEICSRENPGQIELQPAIGGDVCWEATWQPLDAAPNGRRQGWLLVLADVSVRKRTESHLHDLVAERTKEWREATRNLLRAADEEKRKLGQALQAGFVRELDKILHETKSLAADPRNNAASGDHAGKLARLALDLSDTHRRIQDFASLLEGPDLAHQDFRQALTVALERLQTTLGITCQLDIAADFPPPSRERSRHLIEAVREAVISSAQPGEARHVEIVLQNQSEGQNIMIRDDGRPRSEKDLALGGPGASQLRLRTTLLNGRLTVRPGQTGGTTVELHVPPQGPTETAPGFFAA